MSNKGLFGLPQGQRSGAASSLVPWALANEGSLTTMRSVRSGYGNTTSNAWQEITSGLTQPIRLMQFFVSFGNLGGAGQQPFQIGIGAAGSEITIYTDVVDINNYPFFGTKELHPAPYVPANTRIAVRANVTSGFSSMNNITLNYIEVPGLTNAVARANSEPLYPSAATNTALTGGAFTTWDVTGLPPISSGVWITHVACVAQTHPGWSLALGSAGSEQIVAGRFGKQDAVPWGISSTVTPYPQRIKPVWWPANTRLSQFNHGSTSTFSGVSLHWRESLT